MKLWRWVSGRLSTGYQKLTLVHSTLLGVDAYILKIPVGVEIPPHYDRVNDQRHYRVNITLSGRLIMRTKPWNHRGVTRIGLWFSYFRPDIVLHWAPPVERDTYILSVGWVRKK